jgi:hypothetical protein
MNKYKIALFTLSLVFFLACEKNEIETNPDFEIKFGSECGWCAGQEYITLTSTKIEYLRNIPCGEEKGTAIKVRVLSSEEWSEIKLSFDYYLFKTLNYSECNVCADGCDEIIQITEDNNTHELRYSPNNEVEGMQELQNLLMALLEEMRALD